MPLPRRASRSIWYRSLTPVSCWRGRSPRPAGVCSRATSTRRSSSSPAHARGTGTSSRSWTSSGGSRVNASRNAVVLRPEAVKQRLLKLEEAIARLRDLAPEDRVTLRTNYRDAWAAERGLQIAAEALLDIGNHVLSAHYGESPRDYEDVLTRLAARQVIDDALRSHLKGLGGFRNLLVHGYLELDPDRVADYLCDAPAQFTDFIAAIRTWLAALLRE